MMSVSLNRMRMETWGAFGMLGGMTMGMSLIVLNYESFIPHSLAIYGV